MVLPRYLRCLTLVNVVSSMTINGGRWGVGVWCRLVEHLGLAKTDCQAEELGGRRAWRPKSLEAEELGVICFCGPPGRSHRRRRLLEGGFVGSLSWL